MLCVIVICLIIFTVWIVQGNTKLELTEYNVISSKVPDPFDGFEIAQISDLHNAEFGDENKDLLVLLSQIEPNVIVLTGDLIDSRHTDMDIALDFAGKAVQIAPVYYVLLAVLLSLLFKHLREQKTKNPSYDGVSVGQARSTLPERRQREHT